MIEKLMLDSNISPLKNFIKLQRKINEISIVDVLKTRE